MTILVRSHLCGDGAAWWRPGALVSVAVGEGSVDAGRLRVAPAGDGVVTAWKVGGPTGPLRSGPAVARLTLVDVLELPEAGLPATPVDYELGAGCLFITLPAVLRQSATGTALAKPVAYRGVTASNGLGSGVGRSTRSVAA